MKRKKMFVYVCFNYECAVKKTEMISFAPLHHN